MIADIRGTSSLQFGDAATQQAYLAECQRVRRSMTVRFAVAPRCAVTTPAGKVIGAGSEVRTSDLHGGSEPAWRVLKALVDSGRVLEADKAPEREGE